MYRGDDLSGTAGHCCICIPGRACVGRFVTCLQPPSCGGTISPAHRFCPPRRALQPIRTRQNLVSKRCSNRRCKRSSPPPPGPLHSARHFCCPLSPPLPAEPSSPSLPWQARSPTGKVAQVPRSSTSGWRAVVKSAGSGSPPPPAQA